MRRRSARYREHFGLVRGWRYGLLDRPGAQGTMTVSIDGYPKLVLRRGDLDMRTLCHILCEAGYDFPFSVDPSPDWIIDAGGEYWDGQCVLCQMVSACQDCCYRAGSP